MSIKNKFVPALMLCIPAATVAAAPAFEDTMAQRTLACTACHGKQGRAGPDGYYPRLAGKPAGYLYNQLLNFRDGRRQYRLMAHLLDPLSDAYLLEVAQHFASLQVPYPAPAAAPVSPDVLQRGEALARQGDPARKLPACAQCHGEALTGVLPNTPGLLGLPRDYLSAQLGAWRSGQRHAHAPDCMADVARQLAPEDLGAVVAWLAAQPVPSGGKPAVSLPHAPPVSCGSAVQPAGRQTAVRGAPAAAQQRGAYLARVGNCGTCHTARGGAPYAGGRAIETPFGIVFAGNLTPDAETGLGRWNAEDFWRALHHGKSRDGRLLNPAFPYSYFTRVTRADSDALFDYLRSLPAVRQPNRPHQLRWPYGTQAALWVWRTLYFDVEDHVDDAARTPEWNRGAYLVRGLGHCGACHSARNALGASPDLMDLSGGLIPMQNWYAPSLSAAAEAGVADWPVDDIVKLLQTGSSPRGAVLGPMAEVVLHGTQYLRREDARAMALFLKNLPPTSTDTDPREVPRAPRAVAERGRKLYADHCAQCHGERGEGVARAYPSLDRNRAVTLTTTANLMQVVLFGGFAPATAGNPRPFGMPPFATKLGDADVAAVLTYIRGAWNNRAAPVIELSVAQQRGMAQ